MKNKIKLMILIPVVICIGLLSFMYLAQPTDKLTTYFLLEKDGTIVKGTAPLDFRKIVWMTAPARPYVQIPLFDGKPVLSKIRDEDGIMYSYHPYLLDKSDSEWNIATMPAEELNLHLGEKVYRDEFNPKYILNFQLVCKVKREYGGFDILSRRIIEGLDTLPKGYEDAPYNLDVLILVKPKPVQLYAGPY